ncbi:MAG: ribonuclease P protein component [Patescibacteria group bacterium]
MLKSIHRLSTKQFMEVMEKGKIATSPLFVVRILERKLGVGSLKQGEGSQISAVAPKKVASTAVLRNRVRRQIYEAVRPLRATLLPATAIIIFAKNEALKTNLRSMTSDLKQLFVKAKISV